MERALTKFKSGRGRIAIVMMVCLAAVLALPVMAHAATFTGVSQFPADGVTMHSAPGFVSVDVLSSAVVKSATITVGTTAYPATIFRGTTAGAWFFNETVSGGIYSPHWSYSADPAGATAVTSLYANISQTATGTYGVAVTAVDNNSVAIAPGVGASWSFTIATNGVPVKPPVVTFNNATCESCHPGFNTDNAMGPDCYSCHHGNFTPAHGLPGISFVAPAFPAGAHATLISNITSGKSSACASCHGNNVFTVATRNMNGTTGQYQTGDDTFTVPAVTGALTSDQVAEHQGCSCHVYGEADPGKTCADCHTGTYGATHGWKVTGGSGPGQVPGTYAASGHNTPTFGTVGALSKWDGSEGAVVTDSAGAVITQEWPLPTTSVFWSQSKGLSLSGAADGSYSLNPTDSPAVAMAAKGLTTAAINQTVGWGSVITCNDCHTGLAPAGPVGTAAINVGIDPNFPDDWTKAELTSWDPTGMRSIATTMGTGNPYYKQVNTSISGGTFPTVSSPDPAVATIVATAPVGAFMVPVTRGELITSIGPSSAASQTTFYAVYDGSAQADSRAMKSTSYSRGATPGSKFICQKCHKLANSYQGIIIEGNGRGGRDNNLNYMGMSNEAHMEHHNDLINGQGNCASCHIAIPHGWKRPRLLVYESDPAPYKVQWTFQGTDGKPFYQSTVATSAAQDTSNGNWGYFGPTQPSYLGATISASSANGSPYKQIGLAIPNGTIGTTPTSGALKNFWYSPNGLDAGPKGTVVNNSGKTFSAHLEKLSASPLALKELDNGPDLAPWTANDVANGTSWGKWYTATGGTGWIADANPSALYSDEAAQNNCTACSSAGLTHTDTGGTGEGVADAVVTGRQANDGLGNTQVLPDGSAVQHPGGGGPWTAVPYWK